MTCEEITKHLKVIERKRVAFDSSFSARQIPQCRNMKSEIDDYIDSELDEIFGFVRKRDRLAKKLGLFYLGPILDDIAIGQIKFQFRWKDVLVDTENEEIIPIRTRNGELLGDFRLSIDPFIGDTAVLYILSNDNRTDWALVGRDGLLKTEVYNIANNGKCGSGSTQFPVTIRKDDHLTYIDQNGMIVYEALTPWKEHFEEDFSEGKAWVRLLDERILINTKGEEILTISEGYFQLGKFHEGLAFFRKFTKKAGQQIFGLIDVNGDEIFSFDFMKKLARKERNKDPFNCTGPDKQGIYHIAFQGHAYFFDKAGQFFDKNIIKLSPFSEDGIALAQDTKNRYFYINTNGDSLFDKTFGFAGEFRSGLAKVQDESENYFYINKKGVPIIKLKKGEWPNDFRDGVAQIENLNTGLRYVINKEGKKIFDLADGYSFYNLIDGVLHTSNKEHRHKYYDRKGNLLFAEY